MKCSKSLILIGSVGFLLFISSFLFLSITEAVTVGPVKLEINADPGDVVRGELFLMNEEKKGTKTFYPDFEKFIEEGGTKKFIPEESDLATWFEINYPITLNSLEGKNIPFTLRVPEDASPGGHFAVIWWSAASPEAGQVSIVTRAGILVYLTVSGEIKEEGQVLEFTTQNRKKFIGSPPINFTMNFENTGNVHLKPKGEIQIKNIFGKTKDIINLNQKDVSILPQSKKTLSEEWNFSGFVFGPYKANLKLIYGDTQQEIQKSFWIVIIPWKKLLLLILIIVLIFFGIPKGLKKYNQWIVDKYRVK